MTPFEWILVFAAVLLVVVYLFMPTLPVTQQGNTASGLEEFSYPDNSSMRVVPRAYGTVYLKGNCIYYAGLRSSAIMITPEAASGGKK